MCGTIRSHACVLASGLERKSLTEWTDSRRQRDFVGLSVRVCFAPDQGREGKHVCVAAALRRRVFTHIPCRLVVIVKSQTLAEKLQLF